MSYIEINTIPEAVIIQTGQGWIRPDRNSTNHWVYGDIEIKMEENAGQLDIHVKARDSSVKRVVLKWNRNFGKDVRLLGDHWERGYGDLEWRGLVPERVMPWYFLIHDGEAVHGYGVKTGPKAMCFWQVNETYISLCLDVRCGGSGVVLNGKTLRAASVITRRGYDNESSFKAAREFCRLLCEKPLMPKQPVYGGNNWYYAYGKSSHDNIIEDSRLISSLAFSSRNRPFMLIDDGWQLCHGKSFNGGPWHSGNYLFPDMQRLAYEMKKNGVKPGIWFRPLLTSEAVPDCCLMPDNRFKNRDCGQFLDPSNPYVLELVGKDVERLVSWGYEIIKHDFSTYDILGRWGFEMHAELTNDGWHFSDRSKTTAEIIADLYGVIRKAAGDIPIIGCNAVSHIAAGLFEIQRTGDDTSGMHWERTRKMGINTLAFRMPQHGTFYASDADCAGITNNIPWALNEQWLNLLSQSGTPLFVSADPTTVDKEQKDAISKAFEIASRDFPIGEPLDWMQTTCPRRWLLNGEVVEFNWFGEDKADYCT